LKQLFACEKTKKYDLFQGKLCSLWWIFGHQGLNPNQLQQRLGYEDEDSFLEEDHGV